MPERPVKTAADYMAIAACPALIMLLVGSLVFFLLQIGYSGEWIGRLQWTLFWFVLAMVLVSRIAIEQNPGIAFLYGLALAAATSVLLMQYVGLGWGVWFLLGLIWWASNKMVWDCTLIDDDQDASGQGLMQASQLDRWTQQKTKQVRAVPPSELDQNRNTPPPQIRSIPLNTKISTPRPIAQKSGISSTSKNIPNKKSGVARRKQEVHSPGMWVLYFSFAAVPVFGLGELFIASGDTAGRQRCFVFLMLYLTAALGLLLLTSFLGLRRYLRQRYLQMPPTISGQWISTGINISSVVLLLALFLPRPDTPYSMASWITKLSSPQPKASEYALPSRQGGEGKSTVETPTDQISLQSDQEKEGNENQSASPQNQAAHKQSPNNSGPYRSAPKQNLPSPKSLFQLEKWISYLLGAVVLLVVIYRYWPQIRDFLKQILALITGFSIQKPKSSRKQRTPTIQPEPIRLLPNPFHSGQANRMSLAELVQYSFEGLILWAQSRGFRVDNSETPIELAERLSQREQTLTDDIRLLSSYYSHLAYGSRVPPEESLEVMQRLWFVIGFDKAPHLRGS